MLWLQAYDRSLVRLRGNAAATNFALSDYRADLADYYKMQQVRQAHAFSGCLVNAHAVLICWRLHGCKVHKGYVLGTLRDLCGLQKVLQGDGNTSEELIRNGSEFERWIKLGLNHAEDTVDTNTEG